MQHAPLLVKIYINILCTEAVIIERHDNNKNLDLLNVHCYQNAFFHKYSQDNKTHSLYSRLKNE